MNAGAGDPSPAQAARDLARQHTPRGRACRPLPVLAAVERLPDWLERTRQRLSESGPGDEREGKGAEWLLDNSYLVQRVVRRIREDMPPDFYAQLPGAAADEWPRVASIARAYLAAVELLPRPQSLLDFVDAYQEVETLRIGELWALAPMLRIGCLEVLLDAAARLVGTEPPPAECAPPLCGLGATDGVARAIGALRLLDGIDWKSFFQATSRVEAALRRDPGGVYARMDFETRDRYRKVVERLARSTGRPEIEVADRAVALAAGHAARAGRDARTDGDRGAAPAGGADRRAHVGFFLVDAGRAALERELGHRAGPGERVARALGRHRGLVYGSALVAATAVLLLFPAAVLAASGAGPVAWVAGMLLSLLPASALAITLVQWLVTLVLRPCVLPKLDFSAGIGAEARTAVVVPSLLGSRDEIRHLLRQLETQYLCNPDPELRFVLLGDFVDAPEQHVPGDDELLAAAAEGVARLAARHGAVFHLLHRERRWNASEGCWMGWERKRGKLEELNRWLAGDRAATSFVRHEGAADGLSGVRFVITVDADTLLPRGAAARLVGTLAHPLNRASFDEVTGRVRAGYTVIQPRVEVAPEATARSVFTRAFAGDGAIDIYSRAVSDVYQDLFGSGLYVGKGIYDVAAFARSLAGRVPENALASHDLFEGVHGRVALATDVVIYEDYPQGYLDSARRTHRWIRGDWQLLPWLRREVPGAGGRRLRNRLSAIDRWKIADNLRRSLLSPALLALLVAGWLWLPGHPALWTALGLLAPAGHLFIDPVSGLARTRRRARVRSVLFDTLAGMRQNTQRWLLHLAFLPYEAAIALDAIGRTLVRLHTRRHLLEWRSAAHTRLELAGSTGRAAVWRAMAVAPLAAAVLAVALGLLAPASWPYAAPLLLAWALAPEIARWISEPSRPSVPELDAEGRARLRRLARRTWLFLETFAGPEDQWLPPDNVQEEPSGEVAHRTSPTNIGMLLVSTVAAHDLGYVGLGDLVARARNTLDSLGRLARYRGHPMNWYDTQTLEPLLPRYVSTVDSGNLLAALIVLRQGCVEAAAAPVLRAADWAGLGDELALLREAVERLARDDAQADCGPLREQLDELGRHLARGREEPARAAGPLARVLDAFESPDGLQTEVLRALERGRARPHGALVLRELRTWLDRLHQHAAALRRERELLVPWLALLGRAPAALRDEPRLAEPWAEVREALPDAPRLDAIPAACKRALGSLARLRGALRATDRAATSPAGAAGAAAPEPGARTAPDGVPTDARVAAFLDELEPALVQAGSRASELREELAAIGRRARTEALSMDFRFLYDRESHLFHIGFNVTADRLDANHYDLLASEARVASLLAVAKGDVPGEHWFHLARPVTRAGGVPTLLSWGGTMFEYQMPALFTRDGRRTLLALSRRGATDAQIAYGRRLGVPWGISESGFAQLDADHSYQYRAFGVPDLGLRRGLADDLVVAPYASLLALSTRPDAVLANLTHLESLGASGPYGLYEALDFTPSRGASPTRPSVVRSYMAHHQGMILTSLANALCAGAVRRRFHADPLVQTVEILLHERVSPGVPIERATETSEAHGRAPRAGLTPLPSWLPRAHGAYPEVHALGNGRLTSIVTDGGGGGLRWEGQALVRWAPDPTLDDSGLWIYVQDEDGGQHWSATRQPSGQEGAGARVEFHPHLVEFQRRDHGISLRTEIGVAPSDDVEIRLLTLTNETDRPRRLALTSFGAVVLDEQRRAERHPAFSRMFVESEWVPELDALVFRRRPRSPDERSPLVLHRFVLDGARARVVGHESDRMRFIGRGGTERAPAALRGELSGTVGATLDPALAIRVRVELEPRETARLACVTLVASTREALLETARRFDLAPSLQWTLAQAYTDACSEAHLVRLDGDGVQLAQRLLSLLAQPGAGLRAPRDELEANRLGQPRLWGMGVSGDVPILLLHVRESGETALVEELLRVHHLWRRRRLGIDLVLVQHAASGYADEPLEHLRRLVEREDGQGWLGRAGGIHLLRRDQLGADDLRLLRATARVELDTASGPAGQQLGAAEELPARLPAFMSVGAPPAPPATLVRPADLLFDNALGGFTPDGREYVLHLEPGALPPAPWCNVLANPHFGALVSESGGGYTWCLNSSENRLTPWANDPVRDRAGEVLYLRDEETGEVWTVTPRPAGGGATCQVRHGAGYTVFEQRGAGLEQRQTVCVPPDDPVKIVQLALRETSGRARRLTVTYYAAWVLGDVRAQQADFVVPGYDAEAQALVARNPWNARFAERVAFLACDREPHGFTTDRREFLGRTGSHELPAALTRWGLSGAARPGLDPCAALQVHVELPAHGATELHFVLGQGDDLDHARRLAATWRGADAVARGREALEACWDRRLGAVQVKTPDRGTDLMLGRWLLYQCFSARLFGRTGLYQSSGAFGFRDQLQDVMAVVHCEPELAREHLLRCAAHQFEAGDVLHWWHPPTPRGVRTRCSDDMLWLPFVTAHYVEATGDVAVLGERVPFLDGAPLSRDEDERYAEFTTGSESASLFEHCRRALERGTTAGPHGLPLIGSGDWNDGMNRVGSAGRGESVWLAWFLVATATSFARLCDLRDEPLLARAWRQRAGDVAAVARRVAWDGAWFVRAFDDEGRPLGSAASDECRIDSIAQSWSVLCGAVDEQTARDALGSAEEHLVRDAQRLVRLLWPPFDTTPRDPGYIRAYPPGVRENGGQYTHAAIWLAWAFAALGDGDRAGALFDLLDPIHHAADPAGVQRYRVEPYVVAADIASTGPHVGRGGWTWYTGAAGWLWRLGVEAILGLRRSGGGLLVEPCLPRAWGGYEARVAGASGALHVIVEDPDHVGRGVRAVTVDGDPAPSGPIPLPTDGRDRQVRVRLGAGAAARPQPTMSPPFAPPDAGAPDAPAAPARPAPRADRADRGRASGR